MEDKYYSTVMVGRVPGHDHLNCDINITMLENSCDNILMRYRTASQGKTMFQLDTSLMHFQDYHGSCKIEGIFRIQKVPGFLEITLKKAGSKNISLGHHIDHLMLGDLTTFEDELFLHEDIPSAVYNPLRDHNEYYYIPGHDSEYHLQLVHTVVQLYDEDSKEEPYQYVYTHKYHKTTDSYPGIKFFFDWSPITIKYGLMSFHLVDLLGEYAALTGGVFTAALFVHSFLINFFQAVYDKTLAPLTATKLSA